jgi:hypothetical protein
MDEHTHIERLARIETNLEHLTVSLEKLVSRAEFQPVKLITYGLAGGILTAFLSAVILRVMGAA